MHLYIILSILFSCCIFFVNNAAFALPILLDKQNALVFTKDVNTINHKFLTSEPQLQCIRGSGCDSYGAPERVICTIAGMDYFTSEPKWNCEANLTFLEFGLTQVVCEGVTHIRDENVLHGSCKLLFSLHYTNTLEMIGLFILFALMSNAFVTVGCIESLWRTQIYDEEGGGKEGRGGRIQEQNPNEQRAMANDKQT